MRGNRIGELLLAAGLLDQAGLDGALEQQRERGVRLGTLLVEQGLVSEVDLTQILSQQLSVAWVSLERVDFTRELLQMVPVNLAEELMVIPVYSRVDRKGQKILYVAMDDPTNVQAMQQVAHFSGTNVRPLIAPPSEIRKAIKAQYHEE